jgi:DNA-binding CsgD family transcriptional regulator
VRLDAVRRLLERLRVTGGRRLDEDDASFTSSELAVGRMVVPLLDDLDAARRTIDDLGTNTKALAVALDLLPVAALVMDAAGRYLTSNAAARSLFGGAAIPSAVLEAAAKGLAAGTERTVTAIVRPDGALLRAVPADVAAAGIGAGAGPSVVFLVPVGGAIDVRTGPLAARYGLSPMQTKVVTLVARGLTNKEVAGKLDLSSETVKKHLDAVFQRTGVNTRAAVVALAFGARYGVVPPGG